MFIEGISSTATTPEHGLDLSQVRDYNSYIKKCDDKNNSISAEGTGNDGSTVVGPGSPFNSMDEAAANFVMNNNPLTHIDNKERGTYIYKVKIGGEVKYT